MWLFLNNSFLSIVQKPGDKDTLTVRARFKGDIESVFPEAQVEANKGTDYTYRTRVPRETVAQVLSEQVMNLSYPNFKGSVKDRERHDTYMDVWSVMYGAQEQEQRKVFLS